MLLGMQGDFRGVPTNFSHYRGLMNERICEGLPIEDRFFSAEGCQYFLFGGLISRTLSFPDIVWKHCCLLQQLTCDGTPLGIPLKNGLLVVDAWKPEIPMKCPLVWGRLARCIVKSCADFPWTAAQLKEIRVYLASLVKDAEDGISPEISDVRLFLKDKLPNAYVN